MNIQVDTVHFSDMLCKNTRRHLKGYASFYINRINTCMKLKYKAGGKLIERRNQPMTCLTRLIDVDYLTAV